MEEEMCVNISMFWVVKYRKTEDLGNFFYVITPAE